MSVNNYPTLARVVSWMIHFGGIQPEQLVYLTCKNLGCVNPNHLVVETIPEHIVRRFWDLVDVRGDDECWEWRGARRGRGYGVSNTDHLPVDTHRLAWEYYNGQEIPKGMLVCHHCDNPPCCNPHHLFLGTHQDNADDKVRKNRQLRGESCPAAKLTEKIVLEIRRLYDLGWTGADISKELNVPRSRIRPIVLRKEWKHI